MTVGVEDGGGGVATCGRAVRWRGRISGDGEAIAIPLVCARWRGRQGETSGAGEIRRDGRRVAHIHGRTWPYRHGGGETPKLELGHARFKAR